MPLVSNGQRKEQLAQALILLGWLSETREGYTKPQLAARMGVHTRTISRMITAMGEAGFIVHNTEGRPEKRFWVEDAVGGAFISPSAEEMAALALVVDVLHRDNSAHAAQMAGLQAKLTLVLRHKTRRALEVDMDPLVRRQRVAPSPGPVVENDPAVLSLIQTAIKVGTCVEIDYQRAGDALVKRRVLEPWGLLLGRVCYLVAREAGSQGELHNFRLDRVVTARLSKVLAVVDEDWTLDQRLAQSVGVFTGDAHDIVLRVRPHGVAEAKNWRFHSSQTIEEDEDELLVRFHAGGLRELAEHLFIWGDKIRIESPEALREEMRERLALAQMAL